jgi:hypothetical protein
MGWRRVLLITVLLQGLMTPGGGIGTGDIGKDDFPQIPTQSPHTLERACTTKVGFCRVALLLPRRALRREVARPHATPR